MANQSIYNAFERMWQHIIAKIGGKADIGHVHNDLYYTESEIDEKIYDLETSMPEIEDITSEYIQELFNQ